MKIITLNVTSTTFDVIAGVRMLVTENYDRKKNISENQLETNFNLLNTPQVDLEWVSNLII